MIEIKNLVDVFDVMYSAIKDKYTFLKHMRIYACERYLIRSLANWILPIYFKLTSKRREYCLSGIKREKRVIVSLTSFPVRISKLWLVIETLLRQTYKPDMIILWLSREQFSNEEKLPLEILKLKKRGLDIRLVDTDIRSHKKYYYAFLEYPDDYILTVDDDIFYPSSVVENLMRESIKAPSLVVVARYAHSILRLKDGKIAPYDQWSPFVPSCKSDVFFGSGGGTLFPCLNALFDDILRKEIFLELTPLADDIWLNAMCRLSNLEIIVINQKSASILPVRNTHDTPLSNKNIGENMNDQQLRNLRNYYIEKFNIDPFR